MEKASNLIARKVSLGLNLDNDNEEVIAYGAFAILQTFSSILLIIIFGLLFKASILALIIYFTWSILRKYTGGVHASDSLNCLILGTVICITFTVFINKLSSFLDLTTLITLGIVTFTISFFLVNKLAPCEVANKPIRTEHKRLEMRKKSRFMLIICLIISVLLILSHEFINFSYGLTYTLGIYAGLTFQIFTLTNSGHLFINKIDSLLSKTLKLFTRR